MTADQVLPGVALVVWTLGLPACAVGRPFCQTAADRAPASAPDPTAKYAEVVVEAVGCGGNLWLRTRNNGNFPDSLWIIDPETGRLVDSIPGGVVDIHRSSTGDAYALVRRSVNAGRTTLAVVKRVPSRFVDVGAFDIGDAAPLGIGEDQKQPYVITDRNVYERASDGTWVTKALSPPLTQTYGAEVTLGSPARGGSAYVGLNRGEWGGGLLRVDLRTGSATAVGAGDTFTSIVADPRSPECVLAAAALEHMGSYGRVLQVCGAVTRVDIEKELSEVVQDAGTQRQIHWTEAFYSLLPERDGYLAVTNQAIYRVGVPGPAREPLPRVGSRGAFAFRRIQDGVFIVCRDPSRDSAFPTLPTYPCRGAMLARVN